MTPSTPAVGTDAGTAALAYYRREAVVPANTPAPSKVAAPSDLDQMFGYYAA